MAQTITIPIAGMTCASCVDAVRNALMASPGVRNADVRIGRASIQYDAAKTHPAILVDAIRAAGYDPVPSNASTYAGAGRQSCGCHK